MAEPDKKEENIEIRTMKSDLEDLNNPHPKKDNLMPVSPTEPILKEAKYNAPQAPQPLPPLLVKPEKPVLESNPPILAVPPKVAPLKVIPPKEFPKIVTKPLFKITPVWIKIGAIALGIVILVFLGLYGYWKFFIQTEPVQPAPVIPPVSTTTVPILPETPTATTTAPIKFFNKLPNKIVTLDLPSKTPASLLNALKSEAAIEETIASVKQIKITYRGNTITTEEFLNLMSIFTPKDFLTNYENEFAFAFFRQKEGARPILILKVKDTNLAKNQVAGWESAKLSSDIFPLFLSALNSPKNLSGFKSYLFISQPVRYLNVGINYASLNYAIYNNFLIFTTSSAGMFVVLQDLTGQTVSANYLKSLEASINNFVK